MPITLDAKAHQSIPLDESKRHFVFGDIHGRYTTFQNLLESIGYNASTDVIYSVGDLIDRGPDSALVVEFFKRPNCHAILGNHEQMVLNLRDWETVWTDSWAGGQATLRSIKSHSHNLDWLLEFCAALPICLDVGDETQACSFRLIHAECPVEWTDTKLTTYLAGVSRHSIAEGRLLWGRKDITQVLRALDKTGNTDRISISEARSRRSVFLGHTPVSEIINVSNLYWLDTFEGGVMSCIDPVSKESCKISLAEGDRHWR